MPSTQWREVIEPGEQERHERQAQKLRQLQQMRADASTHRALHAKHAGCVRAQLHVLDDLPDHARVGVFAEPAVFEAYARFSNGSSAHQSDRTPDIRGMALKLLDVPGPKILEGLEDATTQDILLIQTPSTPFRTSKDFVALVWAARSKALALPRLLWAFGLGGTKALMGKLRAGLGKPVRSLATLQYFSVLPTKFGEHAVRFTAKPKSTSNDTSSSGGAASEHHLREELLARLREGPLEWDLMAQFFEDEERTPIEDASVEWSERDAPCVPLARIVLPQQDVESEQGRALTKTIEALSFDPWHATEDFRPLGEMMRARKAAYKASAIGREAKLDPMKSSD